MVACEPGLAQFGALPHQSVSPIRDPTISATSALERDLVVDRQRGHRDRLEQVFRKGTPGSPGRGHRCGEQLRQTREFRLGARVVDTRSGVITGCWASTSILAALLTNTGSAWIGVVRR